MTEDLLQKLEEKMMVLLSEVESLRKDVMALTQENGSLKSERERFEGRIKGLVSLFEDVATENEGAHSMSGDALASRPVLVQA